LNVDIELSNGHKIFFAWGNGTLRVDLVTPPISGSAWNDSAKQWPVAASATLRGATLVEFLATFVSPLLRRALTVALELPQDKARHTK
jgi:hypothetical protein